MEISTDLLEKIQGSYKTFSKGQKRIANYVCENYDKAVNLTAAKLGKIVGVSESTVVRFATELGFKGYPQFQAALEEIVKNKLNSIQRISMATNRLDKENILNAVLQSDRDNIKRTKEEISQEEFDRAVDIISAADHIYVAGGRSCEPLSHFLVYYLKYIFPDVRLLDSGSLTESFEDIHRINEKDVIIGITFPRYSVDTVKVIEFSKKRGTKVVALTDSQASPMTKYADCVLYAQSDMVSFADSLVAPLSVINALIAALSIQNEKQVVKTMETLEHIWEEFSVYADKKKMSNVIVIGAGAAGMMTAITAASAGHTVTVAEKNEKAGKKLFITGKGRCNVTNDCDVETLLNHVTVNRKFMYSAFYGFTSQDMMALLESEGLKLKTERGNRVFPQSDKSSDVIKTLCRMMMLVLSFL